MDILWLDLYVPMNSNLNKSKQKDAGTSLKIMCISIEEAIFDLILWNGLTFY